LLGLALADVGRGVGRVPPLHDALGHVGARRVYEQGQLVQMGFGLVHRFRRDGHPYEHDALAESALDKCQASSTVATCSAGPVRSTLSWAISTCRSPPRLCTTTWVPTRPQSRAATAAAHDPVPHARVSPAPRSHTRRTSSSGPAPR